MKKFYLSAVMAATPIVTGSAAMAADDTGVWYVSPMAQYHFLDNKRVSQSDVGYQLGLGYDFASNLAAELNYGQGGFKIKNSGASQRLTNYSLDLLWKFMPESTVRPYLLAGAGETEDSIGGVNNHHAAAAEVGAGLLFGLGSQTGSSRIQLRLSLIHISEPTRPY